ncbi:tetratricopeptide repeat protein [Rhizorhabdus sp.]|uniref:tetratricopeptide repeat protein n=1 Tax=Rhizorhabdus sp. TaxID=1968843 RepID=UPI0025E0D690|nr:tetratricopeptide repeat protein [Rhizorhabdus sp.]
MMFALIAAAAAVAAPAPPAPPTQAEHAARGQRCAALAKRTPDKAMEEARAWASSGGGIAARQCLGLAQAALEQWPAAAATFEGAAKDAQIAQDPVAVILWMQAGNAALAGGESARAGLAFDRTLALPGLSKEMKGEVHLDRARAAVDTGDLPAARDDLAQATKLVPSDPLGWLLRANLARRMKDLPLAFSAIRQAAQLSPDDASIAYEAGNIAAAAGNMADARAAWTKAATSAPDSNAGKAAALALRGGEAKP